MLEFGACPRCKQDISADRKNKSVIICNHCGYTASPNAAIVHREMQKRTIMIYGIFSAVFLGSYIQLANWDNYALEIIPLKIKSVIGMTNGKDADRTGEICMELKKWDCVETAYIKAAAEDQTKLPRLGNFQMKRSEWNQAAQTYYSFFQKGGQDLEASYSYAKALAQLGQVDEATKYFDQVLAARPDVLQVTVVQNYVKLLMDHQRGDQALKLIKSIRSKGPETGSFMEAEYKKLSGNVNTASRE